MPNIRNYWLCIIWYGILGCGQDYTQPLIYPEDNQSTALHMVPSIQNEHDSFNRQVVVITGPGFDLSHPVFENKVLAQYYVDCDKKRPSMVALMAHEFETVEMKKQALLNYLAEGSEPACVLKPGSKLQPPGPLERYSDLRIVWNQAVMSKKLSTINPFIKKQIRKALDLESTSHGTAAAGIIAYQNPNLSIITIEEDLDEIEKCRFNLLSDCPSQERYDEDEQIYRDPEVISAFIMAKKTTAEQQFERIIQAYHVSFVSLGATPPSRASQEAQLDQRGCGHLNLTTYYEALSELERHRRLHLQKARLDKGEHQPVIVQSAGNYKDRVNSTKDSLACTDLENFYLVIGSTRDGTTPSTFSNYGNCVYLYTYGENLITTGPKKFLTVESGTSFSAPLFIRYLTLSYRQEDISTDLFNQIRNNLPEGLLSYPNVARDLIYHVADRPISSFD